MKFPSKKLEKKLFSDGYKNIIAIDEVGMGCLAGPVVVCGVLFSQNFYARAYKDLYRIRDSKLLSAGQRENFVSQLIKKKHLKFAISYCFPKTIDKINIYQSVRLAMRRAILRLENSKSKIRKLRNTQNSNLGFRASNFKMIVLVDGPAKIKGLDIEQMAIVRGDRKVFAISCASIIAKVFRDKMMARYAKKYPQYGFEKHKGYGTKYHYAKLASFGPSEIHRKSFRLV